MHTHDDHHDMVPNIVLLFVDADDFRWAFLADAFRYSILYCTFAHMYATSGTLHGVLPFLGTQEDARVRKIWERRSTKLAGCFVLIRTPQMQVYCIAVGSCMLQYSCRSTLYSTVGILGC